MTPHRNPNPQVFQDSEGNQYATFCEEGVKVALGYPAPPKPVLGCSTMACACGSDDSPLTPVSPEDATTFWEAMDNMAGEASSKW